MYGSVSWTIKKADHRIIDAFELCCWRRLLRVSWTARRTNLSVLKEINPECSLEGQVLKLRIFNILAISWEEKTPWTRPWCWESVKTRGEGDDGGQCHRSNQHEFDPTPGGHGRQEGLVCSGPWGHEESDTTKRLNNNKNSQAMSFCSCVWGSGFWSTNADTEIKLLVLTVFTVLCLSSPFSFLLASVLRHSDAAASLNIATIMITELWKWRSVLEYMKLGLFVF